MVAYDWLERVGSDFKRTQIERAFFCSDEMFVQTTLKHFEETPNITNNRRFMIWRRSMSPSDLTEEEWPQVRESGALFARKFAMDPGDTERYLAALNSGF